MRIKEFFRQVRFAESELKVLNAKLSHYEDLGFSFGGTAGAIGHSNRGTSRVELAACGHADALSALADKRREYMAIIAKAEAIIDQIKQEKYRKILSYRYLCQWSFRSISDELKYDDPNSVYRAHGWALVKAQEILDRMEEEEKGNDA